MTFEQQLHDDLHQHFLAQGLVDKQFPECPDVEQRWEAIAQSYAPDGIREFAQYPTASLGWMMPYLFWTRDFIPHLGAQENSLDSI